MSLSTNKYVTLARREFWEHRSLWITPVVVALVMLVLPLLGAMNSRGINFDPATDGGRPGVGTVMFGQATMFGTMLVLAAVGGLAVFSYLLDCLYGERKDRSILFWKSLPVSDAETVLAKFAVAVVLVPIFIGLLAIIVQPLLLGVMYLRMPDARVAIDAASIWGGLKLMPHFAMTWFYGVLWYAPFFAWLMLASVLAKRVPMMYALMPPVALMTIEGILLNEHHVARFLGRYFFPWTREEWSWEVEMGGEVLPGLLKPDWGALYTNPSLWIGVAVAAAMVYGVIRLRRYRDDT